MTDFIFKFADKKIARKVYNQLSDLDRSDSQLWGMTNNDNKDCILWMSVEPYRLHVMAQQMTGYTEIICLGQNLNPSQNYIIYLKRHWLLLKVIEVYGMIKPIDFDEDDSTDLDDVDTTEFDEIAASEL
jgi:hypothetical protein